MVGFLSGALMLREFHRHVLRLEFGFDSRYKANLHQPADEEVCRNTLMRGHTLTLVSLMNFWPGHLTPGYVSVSGSIRVCNYILFSLTKNTTCFSKLVELCVFRKEGKN
jgi:hypothetical protein